MKWAFIELQKAEYAKFAGLSGHIPANFGNVRRRAVVKSNQISSKKLQMSGKAPKNFVYSAKGGVKSTHMEVRVVYAI